MSGVIEVQKEIDKDKWKKEPSFSPKKPPISSSPVYDKV